MFRRLSALFLGIGLLGAITPIAAALPTPSPAAKPVLPWIEDDWSRAVATAKARKLPIFVESWAPW